MCFMAGDLYRNSKTAMVSVCLWATVHVYGAGIMCDDSQQMCFQCLNVGTRKPLPPHCPLSKVLRDLSTEPIGRHYSLLLEMSKTLEKGKTGTTVILSFYSPPILACVRHSPHTTLPSALKKSICQYLEIRLEEMQALSMHHWGTTAGCLGTCQSGGAFLIINSNAITHISPASRCTPSSHSHTCTHLAKPPWGALNRFLVAFWCIHLGKLPGRLLSSGYILCTNGPPNHRVIILPLFIATA